MMTMYSIIMDYYGSDYHLFSNGIYQQTRLSSLFGLHGVEAIAIFGRLMCIYSYSLL